MRSNTPMLSEPRKPPGKMFASASLRFTHHVKLSRSLWKTLRGTRGRPPRAALDLVDAPAAQACTGGFTSPKAHSYAGSWPFGCMYHSRRNR
jgi:hypothetical protein